MYTHFLHLHWWHTAHQEQLGGSVSCSRTLRQGIELATFWFLNDFSTTVPLSYQSPYRQVSSLCSHLGNASGQLFQPNKIRLQTKWMGRDPWPHRMVKQTLKVHHTNPHFKSNINGLNIVSPTVVNPLTCSLRMHHILQHLTSLGVCSCRVSVRATL